MIDWHAATINDRPNAFLRMLGAWSTERSRGKLTGWRMRWGDVNIRNPGLACGIHNFGPDSHGWSFHIALPAIVSLFVHIPFLPSRDFDHCQGHESWGFSTGGDGVGWRSIHLNWGQRCKILDYPWDWTMVRHEVLQDDGTWTPHRFEWECGAEGEVDGRGRPFRFREPMKPGIEKLPFRYVRRSGEVQDRTAEIYVEEREWRWRWFKLLPYPRMVHRCIHISFDQEVGERTGSWKGGVVGTTYEMRPGETPRECLYRMQRDERFD